MLNVYKLYKYSVENPGRSPRVARGRTREMHQGRDHDSTRLQHTESEQKSTSTVSTVLSTRGQTTEDSRVHHDNSGASLEPHQHTPIATEELVIPPDFSFDLHKLPSAYRDIVQSNLSFFQESVHLFNERSPFYPGIRVL